MYLIPSSPLPTVSWLSPSTKFSSSLRSSSSRPVWFSSVSRLTPSVL